MRAITICCLLMTGLACPHAAKAQLSRFFSRQPASRPIPTVGENPRAGSVVDTIPAVQQMPAHQVPAQKATQQPAVSGIRQTQFAEALPATVVPNPVSELSAGPTPSIDYGSSYVAPAAEAMAPPQPGPPPTTQSVVDPLMSGVPVEGSVVSNQASQVAEPVYADPNFASHGQPYDMPITDVIPQQAAETYSTGKWFRGGDWYSRQEFVMLLRADLPHQHIAVDRSSGIIDPNAAPSLSTKETDFTFESGNSTYAWASHRRDSANRDHSIEFTFWGLFDFHGQADLAPANPENGFGIVSLVGSEETTASTTNLGGFASIDFLEGLTDNTDVDVVHQADFNSFEVNYLMGARPAKDRLVLQPDGRWVRHATPSRVRGIFAGLRYIRQNELFQYTGFGDNDIPTAQDDVGAVYRVTTSNHLFGVQLGSEYVRKRTEWVFGLKGKVSGLVNFADRTNMFEQTTASTETGTRVVSTTTNVADFSEETLTFLGEAGIYVAYYLRPNTSLRLGYDVLYLNGMATATNNLNIVGDQFAPFETTGDSFYHGLNLGFAVTW